MDTKTTITISVNIATGNKNEGNSEFRLTLPERHIKYLDRNQLASELDTLLTKALKEYDERNNQ